MILETSKTTEARLGECIDGFLLRTNTGKVITGYSLLSHSCQWKFLLVKTKTIFPFKLMAPLNLLRVHGLQVGETLTHSGLKLLLTLT